MKKACGSHVKELPRDPVPEPKVLRANAAARKEPREWPFAAGWENEPTEYYRVDRHQPRAEVQEPKGLWAGRFCWLLRPLRALGLAPRPRTFLDKLND